MTQPVLHQFLTAATDGDAISNQALSIRRWLQQLGFSSSIYAQYFHANIEGEVRPLSEYARHPQENVAIYHHSIGSDLPGFLVRNGLPLLLIYHNITPPEYFAGSDPSRMELSLLGSRQLSSLRDQTVLGLADSNFNAQDLEEAGFPQIAVLPIALNAERYDIPANEELSERLGQTGPNLLFVGRLAPNKRQEDLIKLLFKYHRLNSNAHLYLVGDRWEIGYDKWIDDLAHDLDLAGSVTLCGKVSQQDLVTYYANADFYISMSEHEGFGVPLVESMYLGTPVLAYGVSGVQETMGDAGLLFFEKDYEALAELLDILLEDDGLRQRMVVRQREHARVFAETQVRNQFEVYLRRINAYG